MSFVFVATYRYPTGGHSTQVITATNSAQAEQIAEQHTTENRLRLVSVQTLRAFQQQPATTGISKIKASWPPQDYFHNAAHIPQIPVHLDKNTITIRKVELRVWKKKLLRHLAPAKIHKLELYCEKLINTPGLCWLLKNAVISQSERAQRTITNEFRNWVTSQYKHHSGEFSYPILVKLTAAEAAELAPYMTAISELTLEDTNSAAYQFHKSQYCRWFGPFRKARIALLTAWIDSLPETLTLKIEEI